MARITIDVLDVLDKANTFLKLSQDDQRERRLGVASLLGTILHQTKNYNGFNYLPGIVQNCGTPEQVITDDSRRYYHLSKTLFAESKKRKAA